MKSEYVCFSNLIDTENNAASYAFNQFIKNTSSFTFLAYGTKYKLHKYFVCNQMTGWMFRVPEQSRCVHICKPSRYILYLLELWNKKNGGIVSLTKYFSCY